MGKLSNLVGLKSTMMEAMELVEEGTLMYWDEVIGLEELNDNLRAAKEAREAFFNECEALSIKPDAVPVYDSESELGDDDEGEFISVAAWSILYAHGMVTEDNDVLNGACQLTGLSEGQLMDRFESLAQAYEIDLDME